MSNSEECVRENKVQKLSSRKFKTTLFLAICLFSPLFNFIFFYIPIHSGSVILSFQTTIDGVTSLGWENFEVLFNEFANPYSKISESLKNTLIFFFSGLLISKPLEFIFAYFIYKKIKGYKKFRYIFYLPCIIASVVMSSLVLFLTQPNGPLSIAWKYIFETETAPFFFKDSRYALTSMIVFGILLGLGGGIIWYNAAMIRIPESITEYLTLEGVGMGREIVQFIIPLIWPTIAVFVLLSFVGIFTASGDILLYTGGEYNTYTISFYIYAHTVGLASANLNYASAVGLFFTVLALPLSLIIQRIVSHVEPIEY